ncbi:MAG: hypothetical protein GXX92_02900 [Clostridiales bacterium]|nr:hypothetical protein [Clostridiales bacterium]
MNYIKYTRTFVMMEEQTADFSAREAPVKGYLKVETGNNKGALRCVVQNLKYYSRGDYIYKLILFGKSGDRTLHTVLGSLTINRYGNGETYFRFDPLDMDGKGNCFDDFTIAIVAAVSGNNDKEPLHPVLKGIMKKSNSSSDKVESEEEMRGVQLVMNQDDDLLESAQVQQGQQEKPKQEEAEPAVAMQEQAQEVPQNPVNYNAFYNEYLLRFCGYTCKAANYYEDVFPFENDRTGARWKRIQNVASLPLVSPGAHFFATQYRHFLFGAKPDASGVACRYFFAVPGRFVQEEQPDGGRSGFVYWQPVAGALPGTQNQSHNEPGYGYWIVAVDAATGDIIEAG